MKVLTMCSELGVGIDKLTRTTGRGPADRRLTELPHFSKTQRHGIGIAYSDQLILGVVPN